MLSLAASEANELFVCACVRAPRCSGWSCVFFVCVLLNVCVFGFAFACAGMFGRMIEGWGKMGGAVSTHTHT